MHFLLVKRMTKVEILYQRASGVAILAQLVHPEESSPTFTDFSLSQTPEGTDG
jgi:hypothetical protein